MAPMPLTGTIGTSSSLKSGGEAVPHRRTLPEPVVTFHLPTTRRVVAAEKPSKRAKQSVKDTQTPNNDSTAEPELSLEASSILLQSLRQSRLIHLTAMLPYLSNRHRTSTKYHPSPPDHPFPGGLEPTTTPHSLIHLGRADVRIGPLIFPKTRFGEVRVERINAGESLVAAAPKAEPPGQDSTKSISTTSASTSAARNTPAPPKPKVTPATGGTIPPPPPIDDAVVQAVSKAAQKDPKLQALLHTAANGKATPEELRELARFISHVSESLDRDKKKETPKKQGATSDTAAPTTPSVCTAPPASTPSANPTQPSSRPIPPPLQVNQPWHAPIITVEFRENPSARFILPLWRGAAVERISTGNERRIKVTALLPAIGSTAAARAAPTEGKVVKKKEAPREGGKESTSKNHPTSMISPTEEQLTAPAPKGAETHSVTWILSGSLDSPLTDSIWQCFGRVKGVRTMVDGRQVDDQPSIGDVEKYLADFVAKVRSSRTETSFVPQMHLSRASVIKELSEHLTDKFAPRMQSLITKPIAKLKRGGEADDDDVELIRDSNKRSANGRILGEERKNKKGNLAGSHDGHTQPRSNSLDDDGSSPRKNLQQQQHQHQLQPIKRKRHVAKYNSDGTLKLCQACGTNTTPMWRRGPAGKSTLCNACGAKWKVGRLVVPNEAAVDASFNTTVEEATVAEEAAAEQPQAKQPVTIPPTHSTPSPSAREEQTATAPVEVATAIDP